MLECLHRCPSISASVSWIISSCSLAVISRCSSVSFIVCSPTALTSARSCFFSVFLEMADWYPDCSRADCAFVRIAWAERRSPLASVTWAW